MTWKQFRKIAIWLNILLISGAWAVSLISSIIAGGLHDFTGRLPVLALLSILAAIILPVIAFGILHITHYTLWWGRNYRTNIQKTSSNVWWCLGLWLVGFIILITINVLASVTGHSFWETPSGSLMIILIPTGLLFGITAIWHVSRFSFIKKG